MIKYNVSKAFACFYIEALEYYNCSSCETEVDRDYNREHSATTFADDTKRQCRCIYSFALSIPGCWYLSENVDEFDRFVRSLTSILF